jgi:hypothetical protein
MATLEETNKNLGALVLVTEKLLESREEEKKDASFFDVPSPSGEPGGMVDSEGNKLVLSKSGNLMQAGADGKATVISPVGETRKIPNIPSMALPRMGDAGRAGQAEDEAEGTTEPDEEKRNSLLKKMVGFLGDQAKEKGKIAKLGLKGFFGTLIFGGFLIALGQFLQSDTFKKATEFIDKTLIPKLKEFYDAFFGPEGGLFKGIMTLFGDESGIGAIVAGIAGVTALMGVAALKALFSPLTLGLGLFFKGIRLLGRMIPRVPGTPTPPKVPGAPTPPKPPAVATPPKPPAVATPPKPPAVVKPPATVKPPTPAAGGGGVVDKFKHLSKFPLLKKAATKIPLLGPLLSGAFAVQLLLSDASKEEKIKGIGGLLGGGLGAVGFGAVGTALGTVVPGPGNILGGLIGSAIGFFGGEWAGKKLAGFLMGDMVEDEKPKVPGGSSEGKKFNTEPARKQLAAAQDKRMTTSMQLEFMRSQQVVTGETADGIELKGFTGPDAAEKEAQFKDALKADRQAAIEESKAKSQFSYVVSKGKIKNISGLTGDKFNQEELGAKLRFLVGEGVMDDKYAAEQFNGGKTSFEFVAEVNKMYDDLLTQKSKVTPVTGAETTRVMTKSGFKDLTKSEIEEGVKSGEIKRSLGRKAYRRLEMKNRSAGDPAAQGVTRGSMRLGPNVEPQTADLEAAIAKKLAMSGNTSATAATQQGGGNTQINNVTKKDGDVTHMPKSDIRNNKFAALNRSAYAAGAI